VLAVAVVAAVSLGTPTASAVASSGTLWVTGNTGSGDIRPVPLSTLMPGLDYGAAHPQAIAISPDASHVYAADNAGGGSAITVIDPAASTGSGRSDVNLTSPGSIAVSPDGSQLYVGNVGLGTTVAVLNANNSSAPSSAITVGQDPLGIAFTPDGRFAYVASQAAGNVSVIDTSSQTVTTTIPAFDLPAAPCALAVTPDGAEVVVVGGCGVANGGIGIIDTATNTVNTIGGDTDPYEAVAMSPDGTKAYAYDRMNGDIQIVDPRAGTIGATPLEHALSGIKGLAVSPDGSALFATASASNNVAVIDTATKSITPTPPIATNTWADAITPDQPPRAAFSVTPGVVGQPSDFDAGATTTQDSGPATYAWNFGDGASNTTTAPSTSHVYSQPGAYTATLTVTDDQGCSTAFVFTGQTASCNGGPAARASQPVTISPPSRTLSIAVSGNGTVFGPGIDCPGDCTETYADGTAVKLAAAPASGSVFTGFGGDCTGAGACNLTMSSDRSVSASFAELPNTKIKKAKVNRKKGRASFRFKAIGKATGFQCELKRKHARKRARFKRCRSPKTYKHLKTGRYTFEVRALSSVGKDPTPAKKKFKVKP
jgi:YVTN family beta-propeller protein